jgi:hypothetical protein
MLINVMNFVLKRGTSSYVLQNYITYVQDIYFIVTSNTVAILHGNLHLLGYPETVALLWRCTFQCPLEVIFYFRNYGLHVGKLNVM